MKRLLLCNLKTYQALHNQWKVAPSQYYSRYQGVLHGFFYINTVKTNASTMEPHGVWRIVDIPSTPGCRRATPRTWVGRGGQTGRWPLTMLSRVWRSGTDSSTCPAPLTPATNSTNRWLLLRRPKRPGPVDLAPDVQAFVTGLQRRPGVQVWALPVPLVLPVAFYGSLCRLRVQFTHCWFSETTRVFKS